MKSVKHWDKILDEMSSGEESDEYDVPNIVSLKKHGPKLMEMVSNIVEAGNQNSLIQKANTKARANTLSEPVMENFKSIQKEINEAVIKKESQSTRDTNKSNNDDTNKSTQ